MIAGHMILFIAIDIRGCVLKLDCEGCEYSTILDCDDSTLRFFSEIILEYHGNPILLINKLRLAGFRVEMLYPPRLIYAKRKQW